MEINHLIKSSKVFWQPLAIGFTVFFVLGAFLQFFDVKITPRWKLSETAPPEHQESASSEDSEQNLTQAVLAESGIELPIAWRDFGKQMVESGVIDKGKIESLYSRRGGLGEQEKTWLSGSDNGKLLMKQDNAQFLLNLFWGFGLANKNPILEAGPMQDKESGGAGNFASTGGWTLASGDPMGHYSKHAFVELGPSEQALVERVAKNIYRPCCGNSTYFPDCNHGMAMLGLLELMAAQGVTEEEMYKVALQVNAYWFPDTYVTIAKYFENQGLSWSKVDPKEALSESLSSSYGYRQVLSQVKPVQNQGGGGCSV